MPVKYVFHDEPLPFKASRKADAQIIGEALAAVAEAGGGELEPEAVVDPARDPASVLHPHFDWQDAVAAEKWRREQARMIIRAVRVEDIEDSAGEPVRAFHSISDHGRSYRSVQDVQGSPELQKLLLAAAERDLTAFQARYRSLKDVCAVVETAKQAVRTRRAKTESRPSV